jgi:hypothetical protein
VGWNVTKVIPLGGMDVLLESSFPNKTEVESDQEQNGVNDGTQAVNSRSHHKMRTNQRYRSARNVEVKEYSCAYKERA